MPDIAQLGIAVDSSQAEKGSLALDKLAGAGKRAQAAVSGVTGAAKGAGAAAASVATGSNAAASALDKEAAAARRAAQALEKFKAANTNARGANRMNTANIAAQFQDIAVSAQMGMGPLQVALQQGTQLAAVLNSMENPLKGLGAAFMQVINPVSLLTIGLIGLATVGLQAVDWAQATSGALTLVADSLEAIAPYAAGAAAALTLLYAPSIITGVGMLATGIVNVTKAFIGLMATLAVANPLGAIVAGVAATITALYIFRDAIQQTIGIDLIGIVKNAGNMIINSFEAAYSDVKFIWSNFGNMIGAAVIGGVNLAITGINALIEQTAKGIDWLIEKFNKIPGVNIPSVGGIGSLRTVANPFSEGLGAANDNQAAEIQRIMGQDRLGQFGEAIASGASVAADKVRELAKWMGQVDEEDKKKKRGGKTEAEKYEDITKGAQRRIASLQAEYDALGLTEYAAAKLAYETDLLNEAQQKGITLTAAQRAELSALAGEMATLEIATAKAKEAMDFARDVTKGFFADFMKGIQDGKSLWESFADAALGALDKIIDKLLNEVVDALFEVNKAGTGGGGGGILGSILGGLFGGGGSIPSGIAGPWGASLATGGYTGRGGKYQPKGVVHANEYVFSSEATTRLGAGNLDRLHKMGKRGYANGGLVQDNMPVFGGGVQSGGSGMHVTVGVSVDKNGNLEAYIKNISEQTSERVSSRHVSQYDRNVAPRTFKRVNEDRRKIG